MNNQTIEKHKFSAEEQVNIIMDFCDFLNTIVQSIPPDLIKQKIIEIPYDEDFFKSFI